MKPRILSIATLALLAFVFGMALTQPARAASGTWTTTASGGLWSDTSNWLGGTVASGSGSTANFNTLDLTADNTVHLDSAQTISSLIFGDTATGTAAGWTIDDNANAANTLTIAASGNITVNPMGSLIAGTDPTDYSKANAAVSGNTTTISAALAGSSWTKLGGGTLVLTGPNTFSGAVTIGNGTNLGTSPSGGVIRLDSGGSLTVGSLTINTIGTIAVWSTGLIVNGGTATITGNTLLSGGTGVHGNFPARSLVEVDSGTATFTGAFATTTEVTTIKVTGGTALFSSTFVLWKSSGNSGSDTTAHSMDLSGTAAGLIISGGNTTFTGNVTIGQAGASGAAIISGGTVTMNSGLLLGNGVTSVNRGGGLRVTGGTLTVGDTTRGVVLINRGAGVVNQYSLAEFAGGVSTVGKFTLGGDGTQTSGSGNIYVDGGTLYVGSGGIVKTPTTGYVYAIKLGGSGFLPGNTVVGGVNAVPSGGGSQLTGDGVLGAAADWSSALNVLLGGNTTVKAADASDTAHNITLSGILSGTGGLVKSGGGTLTLSGTNTYTGATVANAGTLQVNGSLAAGGAVAVNGTLGGTGTVNAPVTLNSGGSMAPGTNGTVGTLNGTALTWNGGGQLLFDLGTTAAACDKLALSGALTKGSAGSYGFVFNGGTGLAIGTTVTLVTCGSTTFTAADLSASGGPSGSFAVNGTSLQYVVAPATSPDAPVITGIIPDNGSSSTDGITSATNLTITGTTVSGATVVTVTQVGTGVIGTAIPDGSNHWSFDYTGTTLPEGSYTFTANATNVIGTGADSAPFTAIVDTTAPGTTTITSIGTTIPLVFNGTADAGSTVTVSQVGTGAIGTSTADGSGNWNFTYAGSTSLGAGDYTFTATSTDTAGNAGLASTGFVSTVIPLPPAPVISGLITDTGSSPADGITSVNTIALNGTAQTSSTVTVTRAGSGMIGTTPADGSGNWSFDYTGTPLADGAYTFTATAANSSGTGPASGVFVATVDTMVPSVSSVNRQNPGTTTATFGSNVTYQVVFNEAVTGVDLGDFTLSLSGNTTSGTLATVTPVNASTYNVTVNNVLGAEGDTVRLDLNASGTDIADLAGNAIGSGFTAGQTYSLTAATGNGAWINTVSGGLWSDFANWSGGTVASGTGNTANFNTLDLTADNTVHLDSARTITGLIFGDTDPATSANWIVDNNSSAGNSLTLAGTTPSITVNALGAGSTTTINAVLAGTTAWSKAGAGTLVLSQANTDTGAITITGGAIRLDTGGSLSTSTMSIAGLTGTSAANNALIVNGGTFTASGAISVTGGTGPALYSLVEVDSGNATFTGGITTTSATADGARIKIAGGTVTASSVTLRRSGTSVDFSGTASGFVITGGNTTISGAITLGTNATASMVMSGGSLTVGGNVVVGSLATATPSGGFRITGGTFTCTNTAAGGFVLVKRGSAVANQSAVAEFAGGISTVAKLSLGGDTTLATGSASVYVDGGALYIGGGGIFKGNTALAYTIKLGGTGPTPGAGAVLSGDGLLGASDDWNGSENMILSGNATIKAADASDLVNDITLSGILSGTGSLIKTGAGQLSLYGNNTYTGTTLIVDGLLTLDGTLPNGGAVTVTSGGILGGSGTITPAIVLNSGGAIAPGELRPGTFAIGMLHGSSLTWNAGGQMLFDLNYSGGVPNQETPGGVTGFSVNSLPNPLPTTPDQIILSGALTKVPGSGPYQFIFSNDNVRITPGTTLTLMTFASTNFTVQDFSYTGLGTQTGSFVLNPTNLQFVVGADPTFAGWSSTVFTGSDLADPAISGTDADPDSDGVSNLLEYAFGLDPKQSDRSGLPAVGTIAAVGQQYLTLTYTGQAVALDLTYNIQASNNLMDWSTISPTVLSVVNNSNGTQTVTVQDTVALSAATTPRFLRCQVVYAGAVSTSKVIVRMIGDSTMANKSIYKSERGWGMLFPEYFKDPYMIANYAINGESTKSFINEGLWDLAKNAIQPGDFVIIQFGTNDSKTTNSVIGTSAQGDYKTNLITFITDTIAKGGHPVIASSVPHNPFLVTDAGNLTNYTTAAQQVATAQNVPFLDMFTDLSAFFNGIGSAATLTYYDNIPAGVYASETAGTTDSTHFQTLGAYTAAGIAVQQIKTAANSGVAPGTVLLPLLPYLK